MHRPKNTLLHSLLFLGAMCLLACQKEDNQTDDTPPILTVVPVNLAYLQNHIAFGEVLSSMVKSPAIEYIMDVADAPVSASASGTVVAVVKNEGYSDYEIRIKPSKNSAWTLIYDHVLDPQISVGQSLSAGDLLGTAGEGNRTELQINKNNKGSETSYCPLDFGSDSFVQNHLSQADTWCLETTVTP